MMPAADFGVVHLTSERSATTVLETFLALLLSKKLTVFTILDHSGEAARAGLIMRTLRL